MKKILFLTSALALVVAGSAFAGQAAKNTGCGLGTVLWGDKADGSILSQSLQATTNGTFGNQTFGITSGTLGCDQPESLAQSDKLFEFAAGNLDNLARDIARGSGESLDTLAELMAVPQGQRVVFNASLQQNFDEIFATGDETPGTVLIRIAKIAG
ncbi:hypothetical protein DESUT3_05070 [Desulfuromonas versatilis]|uniref:DUF3015 domain-containing protein n=1 Tax=Desulfuromonas versatilis TaxID=2802975 RepID=A0ABN6DTG6_9BACT|nr:DUF3015 family protein [Desulfuromonas versatilis]BCR03438.1 hypothetical protein DESUT3_05070 [Desulfuromonas versatilis]